jgi:hypothetical protein
MIYTQPGEAFGLRVQIGLIVGACRPRPGHTRCGCSSRRGVRTKKLAIFRALLSRWFPRRRIQSLHRFSVDEHAFFCELQHARSCVHAAAGGR